MAKKYVFDLNTEEQALLNEMITPGIYRVRKTYHARILLKADAGSTDEAISEALNVNIPTIQLIWQRFMEQSLVLALTPSRSRRKYHRLLDGV
jgi:ribosomal protein S2